MSVYIDNSSSDKVYFDDFEIERTEAAVAVVVQENHYYPFGMNMKGIEELDLQSLNSKDEYRFQYNGKEKEESFGLNWTDYGWRNYDMQLGRFTKIDRFSEKYYSSSSYHYVLNNPISSIDINGDSTWVTTTSTTKDYENGIRAITINHTIHIEGKVLDLDGVDAETYTKNLNDTFNALKEKSFEKRGNIETTINYSFQVNFSVATSMDDVNSSDHLMVLVDDVVSESDSWFGTQAVGLANLRGKISYVEGASVSTGIHELGHNLGLIHTFEQNPPVNDPTNYMSYSDQQTSFNTNQLSQVVQWAKNGELNQGSNSQKYTGTSTNNYFWHTSTNTAPYYFNVKNGAIIPKILTHK